MDHFVDLDFFQNKCSILVKHLYITYLFCGAVCYENFMRIKSRCIAAVYLLVAYLCCIIPQRVILLDRSLGLQDNFVSVGYFIFIHVLVISAILFYKKKSQFNQIFNTVNEFANGLTVTVISEDENETQYLKETNIMTAHFNLYIYHGVIFIFMYLSKIFYVFMSIYGETPAPLQVNPESEFFIPYFCNSCNSTTSYIIALHSATIVGIAFPFVYIASLGLFGVLSMHLKNRAIAQQNTIRYQSNLAAECLKDNLEQEEQESNKMYPSSFRLREIKRQREQHIQEYMVKVRGWIKIHQQFIRSINQYRTCAKNILELMMFNSSLCVTFMGYFISRFVVDNENLIYDYLPYICVHVFTLMICCKIGNDLNDANEMISDAIYSTPWYYLPAKEQKVILIFLTLSQRSQELRIFNVFSLSLELIPEILNQAYGYIQIMRLLVMRDKK